ncbi:MAG TPA: dihydrofolate reductase family protein [Gaiellaceae bacterium]|nr:dihydrofolate reductase family protein [Gaiellaceae bacterium]
MISESVSLDGVVEDPGLFGDFKHKGWTLDIDRREDGKQSKLPLEVQRFLLDEALGMEAMLLGRITYEELAPLWPAREGELADRLNSMPKYVVSSTLEDPGWNNSTVLRGDAVEEVLRLKRELDGDINVPGSIRLARTLIEHDLVDKLRLMIFPVVLGSGERLFAELPDKKGVRLVDTKTIGDGIAILSYEPVRDASRQQARFPVAGGRRSRIGP